MADDAALTKRARQKRRRQVKKHAERRAAARARRRRIAMFAGMGLVVVGLVGAAVGNVVRQRAAVAERQRVAEARLDELGCGEIEEQPIRSTAHFTGAELVANPPEVAYADRPAAGGRMAGGAAEPGVYDQPVDERLIVHSLEHGFVTLYYGPQADKSDVESLEAFAREQINSYSTLIVAPYTDPLPSEANFAALSWGKRQLCHDFDEDVLLSFVERNHGNRSGAPESSVGSMGGDNPIRPDGEGPFLLPPLTAGTATEFPAPAPTSPPTGINSPEESASE